MAASDRARRLLAFRSGNHCAFPECPARLLTDGDTPALIGEAAHIEGEEPASARYNPAMTPAARNALPNLAYLCPNHHTLIDAPETIGEHSVSQLQAMKLDHEARMAHAADRANVEGMARVTFLELKLVIDQLAATLGPVPQGYDLTPLAAKIALNRLSSRSQTKISLGLARVNDVSNLLQSPAGGEDTATKIVYQFRAEYNNLRAEGMDGDELFDALHSFASVGSVDVLALNAGLALLTYLFERCDVFEVSS